MRIDMSTIVYGYLFVCALLMVFNFIHIFRSKHQKRNMERHAEKWYFEVLTQIQRIRGNKGVDPHHRRMLSKQLLKTDALISFSRSLGAVKKFDSVALRSYVQSIYPNLQELALQYGRRDSMERAFFAHVVRRFPPCGGDGYQPLIDILLSYLNDSTVYCRENVLSALYALGNIQAIENALNLFNDSDWFHHHKLISDGLSTFTGDKESLAARLWGWHKKWDRNLMLAVVEFITKCSDKYRKSFYSVLQATDTDPEIRLAIMRYYRRYTFEPVQPILRKYLTEDDRANDTLALVAASVLAHYPGGDTVQVLKQALAHPNWYVRNNAAMSLMKLQVLKGRTAHV